MHVQCDGWFVAVVLVRLCWFECDGLLVVRLCVVHVEIIIHAFAGAHRFSFRVLAHFGVGWHGKRAGSRPKARSRPFFGFAGKR